MSFLHKISIALLLFALAGCGFQPRGADALPAAMSRVHIQGDKSTELYQALRRALLMRNVAVVSTSMESTAQFVLLEEDHGQRILSVAATDGPEEYEVFQTATFSLSLNDTPAIESQRLTLTRDYTFDKDDILGKRHEYESLRSALAVEMAQAILRRARYAP